MTAKTKEGEAGKSISWRALGWGTAGALLLLPLAAMQVTDEVDWTASDFVFAGLMFALVGGTLELAIWRSQSRPYRIAVGVAVAAGFLHLWLTGAVGIIGNESNPGNLLYLAVVAAAVFGSMAVLGRARAMAWVMGVTAFAELLVLPIAYAGIAEPANDVLQPEVFACAALFAGMWCVSAWLFGKAARETR